MIQKIIIFILDIFDFFHKRKILNFLKSENLKKINIFFDIGAHKGETIKLFSKNFEISQIYSFEASPINFKILEKNINKLKIEGVILENIALSSCNQKLYLKQVKESSSSTFSKLNFESKYLKKKKRILNLFSNNDYFKNIEIQTKTLKDYIISKNIKEIDFLKIDTEGHEMEILIGLQDYLQKVKIILFEHHFDDMIEKEYTFRDINSLLTKNHFIKVYKSKMPFRKSFEYIYVKKD